jgi:hypothetical protein
MGRQERDSPVILRIYLSKPPFFVRLNYLRINSAFLAFGEDVAAAWNSTYEFAGNA